MQIASKYNVTLSAIVFGTVITGAVFLSTASASASTQDYQTAYSDHTNTYVHESEQTINEAYHEKTQSSTSSQSHESHNSQQHNDTYAKNYGTHGSNYSDHAQTTNHTSEYAKTHSQTTNYTHEKSYAYTAHTKQYTAKRDDYEVRYDDYKQSGYDKKDRKRDNHTQRAYRDDHTYKKNDYKRHQARKDDKSRERKHGNTHQKSSYSYNNHSRGCK